MTKFLLFLLALFIVMPAPAKAESQMYVLGTGKEPDARTRQKIEEMRLDMGKARADAARRNIYIYNGDEGFYVGRGYVPYMNRQTYDDSYAPSSNNVAAACAGLRNNQFRRCVDDAEAAQEKLLKKYRNR